MPWITELEQLFEKRPDLLTSLVTTLSDLMADADSLANGVPALVVDLR